MKPSEMSDEELVRAVSEEVMGWETSPNHPDWWGVPLEPIGTFDHIMHKEEWQPLHRADHWWMVVERMGKLGWYFRLYIDPFALTVARFWRVSPTAIEAKAETNSNDNKEGRAVLEAALSAVRGKEGE